MTSFWNLFMLFVAINIPFAFMVGAFEASPAFDCDDLNNNGICEVGEPTIDFSELGGVEFPEGLRVNYTDNPETSCGTADEETLVGQLCNKAVLQNLNITAIGATGKDQIIDTPEVSIFSTLGLGWIDQISDFGQIVVFGVSLLFSAVTGGFIVSVITSFLFADQFPPEFVIGVQVFIGLMWLSFFLKMTRVGSPNPAE